MTAQDGLGKSRLSNLARSANENHLFLEIFQDVRGDISHEAILTVPQKVQYLRYTASFVTAA
jgi:hypothetical protein